MLIAVQGAAWLLVSLPMGVLVDRFPRAMLIAWAQALAGAAFVAATAAALAGSALWLGMAAFVGASGAVVVVLASLALVPDLVGRESLPRANARLELARAAATLCAPVVVGLLAQRSTPTLGYALAMLASMIALVLALPLRKLGRPTTAAAKPPLVEAIRDGGAFALRHSLLRGIVLCAVCWNFAFFALMAVAVPFALERIRLDTTGAGIMQGGYGAGLMLGALAAGPVLARLEPRAILIAGPALSTAAALLLAAAPHGLGLAGASIAFFLLGFGPMLWLICQTSIRQLVTPPDLLGRVAAVVQVAIYGVRPLGALAGGWTASVAGLDAALLLVLAGFTRSLAVPAASSLGRLKALPDGAPA